MKFLPTFVASFTVSALLTAAVTAAFVPTVVRTKSQNTITNVCSNNVSLLQPQRTFPLEQSVNEPRLEMLQPSTNSAKIVDTKKEKTLDAMELAESEGFQGTLHPDGKSYRWYGITVDCVNELVRLKLMKFKHPDSMTKAGQRETADKYLTLMKKRYHCKTWVDAAGHYHNSSGQETKNESPANRIDRRIYREKLEKYIASKKML